MNNNSQIIARLLGIIYPFILIFGFYIILNGHITPGGGFQGGAVLSAAFISRYLVIPVKDIKLHSLQIIEKALYILIITVPVLFLFTMLNIQYPVFNQAYLVLMNVLIGIKVCCGFSIIFFRFVFYESR